MDDSEAYFTQNPQLRESASSPTVVRSRSPFQPSALDTGTEGEALLSQQLHQSYPKMSTVIESEEGDNFCEEEFERVDLEDDGNEDVRRRVVRVLEEGSTTRGIKRVELSWCKLRILPEDFGKIHGLTTLDLSHNHLEVLYGKQSIPDSIAGLKKLQELNVSSNLLKSLPDSIGLLINLKVLNVSGNKLTSLPLSIGRCRSLVELDTSFNNIRYLPSNVWYGLVNLRKLSIHLNKIQTLPPSICEMWSLTYLDAHFNELSGVPYAIGRLANLEVLNLSKNFSAFTVLPESFGELLNLRDLDLSNNQIRALPDTFGWLENLNKLNLDQNPIVIPSKEIVSKGVEAVRDFMLKRWINIVEAVEPNSMLQANKHSKTVWWALRTCVLKGSTLPRTRL
ncbi:unnamed protein product [Camellia sinensis]